jgi:glycosyltransferase involved in cell wall biosynthesis
MKITYLLNSSIPSNLPSSLQVAKMCEGMQENSHNVSLITPMPGQGNFLKFYNIKTKFNLYKIKYFKKYPLGLNYYLFSIISILYAIKLKSDLFVTRNFFTCFLLVILKKKTIFEIHHDITSEGRIVKFLFNNFKIFNCESVIKVVAISNGVKKYLIADLGTSKKKIQVLPSASGLNIKNWRGNINVKKNKINIGYFGSLEKTKGVNFLIKISKKDKSNNYFIFGGTKENVKIFRKKIISNNLLVKSHVPYKDLKNYLLKMDVLVMPYDKKVVRSAGGIGNISKYMSPLKLFDYLASGKLVIATKINSIEEIVQNKKNCILINKLDVFDWHNEIKLIIKHKKRYEQIAKNGFELSKKYTYNLRAKKFLDLKWKQKRN